MKKISIFLFIMVEIFLFTPKMFASVVSSHNKITYYEGQTNFGYYLDNSNNLYASGNNTQGQLALGVINNETRINPVKIMDNVKMVASGKQGFAIALTTTGELKSWGNNKFAQLGLNTAYNSDKNTNKVALPQTINFPHDEKVIDIKLGDAHALVLTEKGHVYSFGSNLTGQLGLNLEAKNKVTVGVPTQIDQKYFNNEKIIQIASCEYTSFALSENGNVYGFGENDCGLILNEENKLDYVTTPIKLDLNNVKKISAKSTTAMALTNDLEVYGWGNNSFRQLGNKDFKAQNTKKVFDDGSFTVEKVRVDAFYNLNNEVLDVKVKDIMVGGITNFILSEKNELFAFGDGANGQASFDVHNLKYQSYENIEEGKVIAPTKVVFYETINIEEEIKNGNNTYTELLPVDNTKTREVQVSKLVNSIGDRTYVLDSENNMWSFGDNSFGLANSGNVAHCIHPVESTLYRVMNYDKTVPQKNYLIRPLIILSIVFVVFFGCLIRIEIKRAKLKKEFAQLNEEKGEKKDEKSNC